MRADRPRLRRPGLVGDSWVKRRVTAESLMAGDGMSPGDGPGETPPGDGVCDWKRGGTAGWEPYKGDGTEQVGKSKEEGTGASGKEQG